MSQAHDGPVNGVGQISISVVCCTHNRVAFVRRHCELLRERITPSCEILYALDHCSDGTLAYLQRVAAEDSRVRFVINDGPQGLFSCRNFGVRQARGRFLHFLDDDDTVSPKFYSAIDASIAAGVEGDMFLTDLTVAQEGQSPYKKEIIDRHRVPTRSGGNATIVEGDLFEFLLNGRLYFYNGNALIRRSLLELCPFRAEIRKSADWLLYLELSHRQALRLIYVAGVHATYLIHASSMSIGGDKSYWNMKAFQTLYELIPRDHAHHVPVRQVFAKSLFDAGYAASRQDKRAALQYYWRSASLGRVGPALAAIAKLPFAW